MSKRKQRLQSIYDVGYKIGMSIWKDHKRVDKSEFRKLFNKRFSGYRRDQPLANRAAVNGYVNALNKADTATAAKEFTDNATQSKETTDANV